MLFISSLICVFLSEIVEEQQCHDFGFRLTCRDLDSHIAVLEAWYTSMEDYQRENSTQVANKLRIKTENDSELNRVYVYASPKHNGVYEQRNQTGFSFDNASLTVNNTFDVFSDFVNDTIDMGVEFVNSSGCGAVTFSRSYGSWRECDKRRKSSERNSSINLRAPVSYR
jgi:hypothetical protein